MTMFAGKTRPVDLEKDTVKVVGLPAEGLVRLKDFLGAGKPLPISKSAWWAGVKAGLYPQPVKLGHRTTAWRVADIRALIATGIDP